MIKRTGLVVLAFFLLLIPSPAKANSGISVLSSSVEINFPYGLVFNLEAESDADIIDARLHYQVDKANYAQVISEAWAQFAPAPRIETSWTCDMARANLPPGAMITYWWTVRDAVGNSLETAPGVVCFDDNRYSWQNLTDDGLTLFWYKGSESLAEALMSACEDALDRLARETGTYPGRPIKIYIYASTAELQGALVFPQEWTGGVAFTDFSIIAIGISPDDVAWGEKTLVHELTHLIVHQATYSPYCTLPTWLDEGLAVYSEGGLDPYFQSYLEKAVSENKLLSVRSLSSPFSAESEKAYLSYAESYSLVEYLISNYGKDQMLNLLISFKQGKSCDEALTEVYGFDTNGLDNRWRETLLEPRATPSKWWQSYPALVAVLAALATSLVLAGALALEDWDWQRSYRKGRQGKVNHETPRRLQ